MDICTILIILYVVLNIAKSIYADWLWFDAEGYSSVYSKTIITKVWLFFAGAGVFLAFFLGNLLLALRLMRRPEGALRIAATASANADPRSEPSPVARSYPGCAAPPAGVLLAFELGFCELVPETTSRKIES